VTLIDKKTDAPLQAVIGPQGRVVVPASIRKEFGWKEGTKLSFSVRDGELVVSDQLAAMRRLQDYMRDSIPEGTDILQDFLEERRRNAERENSQDI
jgi:AbrB family looped-hinge helix DNA binding protein